MQPYELDTQVYIETPENTELAADQAGLPARGFAFLLDALIRAVVLIAVTVTLSVFGNVGIGIILIIAFFLEWLYPVVFEIFRRGQTPGKKAVGLRVLHDDLTPIGMSASLTRNLLRTADFMPGFFFAGGISMILSKRFQRLGDLAAGTVVVYDELNLQQTPNLEQIKLVTPWFSMSQLQQDALINFTVNRSGLSQARRDELAKLLTPVLGNDESQSATSTLSGVGKWLLGQSDRVDT